jgi:hypothetical protein
MAIDSFRVQVMSSPPMRMLSVGVCTSGTSGQNSFEGYTLNLKKRVGRLKSEREIVVINRQRTAEILEVIKLCLRDWCF